MKSRGFLATVRDGLGFTHLDGCARAFGPSRLDSPFERLRTAELLHASAVLGQNSVVSHGRQHSI
jgi:hypothetical protein